MSDCAVVVALEILETIHATLAENVRVLEVAANPVLHGSLPTALENVTVVLVNEAINGVAVILAVAVLKRTELDVTSTNRSDIDLGCPTVRETLNSPIFFNPSGNFGAEGLKFVVKGPIGWNVVHVSKSDGYFINVKLFDYE